MSDHKEIEDQFKEMVLEILKDHHDKEIKTEEDIFCIEMTPPGYHCWIYVMPIGVDEGSFTQMWMASKKVIEIMVEFLKQNEANGIESNYIVPLNDTLQAVVRWK